MEKSKNKKERVKQKHLLYEQASPHPIISLPAHRPRLTFFRLLVYGAMTHGVM
jgi:hypothetical protein